MGMFDYVNCKVPLPDGYTGQCQTKDFDCEMKLIEIREDGLWIEDVDYEEVPLADRPYPDATDWRSIVGSVRSSNQRWRNIPHHGHFRFYALEGDPNSEYLWHEYDAVFNDGCLVQIEHLPTQEP